MNFQIIYKFSPVISNKNNYEKRCLALNGLVFDNRLFTIYVRL